MTDQNKALSIGPITGHDLNTSEGGRGFIADFFKLHLDRHDFSRYIKERLAADFACALSGWLSPIVNGAPVLSTQASLAELSKDPLFRELVNALRDTANEHYKTDKLREHISSALLGHFAPLLADRDQFSRMYDSASAGLCAIGEALGVDEADQSTDASIDAIHWLQSEINDLKLQINAREARNVELEALLLLIRDQPMLNPLHRARIKTALAQSKPATNNSGKAHCPHDGICHTSEETCSEAQARIAAVAPANIWPCWSCDQPVSMGERADADGNCPHCAVELDIEMWPFPGTGPVTDKQGAEMDERAEFERDIGSTDLSRLPTGEYQNGYVQARFEGWQARANLNKVSK